VNGPPVAGLDYRRWQTGRVEVGGRAYRVATKPGLPLHGQVDPATTMLANAVTDVAGLTVVSMPSGHGLVGAVALVNGANAVWMTDRNVLGVEASRRTLEANALPHANLVLAHGASGIPAGVTADIVALRVVPEKAVMVQLLHDAMRLLRPGGRCFLAGGNHEGAKSSARLLERLFGHAKLLEQHSSHRMVMAVRPIDPPPVPDDLVSPFVDPECFREIPVTLQGHTFTMHTRPGVFSWEHLDEATDVLSGLIDVAPGARVLDLGCGAGALGAVAALASRTGAVYLVDADHEATRCAERTLQSAGATNARVVASDVAASVADERFDVVVANPPFHVGIHTNLDVPRQFIHDAFDVLEPGGRLLLVANRTLPYEGMLKDRFGSSRSVYDGRRFKVLEAIAPARRG
jgi:16S rRNA (guanine1207-N2)-methyltransferase